MDIVAPNTLGFNTKRLQRIDDAINRFVDDGRIAGAATLLLRKGQIVHRGNYGMASNELNRPMRSDTLFRLWSMTKAITTVAALTLYEQGRFLLDQDITEYLPEFKDTPVYVSGEGDNMVVEKRKAPITIRQVMSHSSGVVHGIGSHPTDVMMGTYTARIFEENGTLPDAIKRISEIPLIAQPGTRWHYGHNLELIARLVEVVSGQRYVDYLRTNVLEPLGMVDTDYYVPDEKYDRFSAFYGWDADKGYVLREAPDQSPEYLYRDYIAAGKSWTAGGFGLVSTPQDGARFAQMLLNGGTLDGVRVLAPRTVALMSANHLPASLLPYQFPDAPLMHGYGHGLGVHVLMDHGLAGLPCKNGEFWKDGGSGTLFWVDPALEIVGVAMYQLFEFPRVPVFGTFRATAYQALEDI